MVLIDLTSACVTVIEPEYKKVGLEMEVTPYVSSSNEVRLIIKLKDTAITGQVLLAGDQYPILANRELTTDLVTSDGRTIFLGGIRRQDVTDSSTRIPGPADIPGVGAAFRNKNMNDTGSELIILATATVILDQQGADIVTRALMRAARDSLRPLRPADQPTPATATSSTTPADGSPAGASNDSSTPNKSANPAAKASATKTPASGSSKASATTTK
jgi:type II secretory pathway component GspD/PulD (secretin)